ncbi:MAG TPA: AlpA family phage regulatory protein [Sphingomicrobium sp.]|nr:AlpA family phage regulatory protein [Sphingomicrobium sp.]
MLELVKRSAISQRLSDRTFPRSRSLEPKCAFSVEAEIDAWIQEVVQLSKTSSAGQGAPASIAAQSSPSQS